ncbi:peptidoglycan/LPS O-acetylase OafA/YrhL [Acetobacter aceti NBRC 14818]|uniref:Acyltransferase n=1 Tax=Acetobacter aceti NBRC 14818 TaxID=887700 RepID=A0AB33IFT7_ACEAC|nr:acyltransferase [Acetobacter aceti]TCS28342.1 peptidoglycan/LPS O-acetylase OafA/YrhL [Acetobacter aceti NBRC 14818]BCK75676.1 acyltransferase [Acetobacter aceti NBRC 14818]GAN56254.1 acyltransferase 3 [Acetobacter aceti NBRC 14818]
MDTKKEIKSLTGIRGIAACWIVAYHTWLAGNHRVSGYIGTFLLHGYLAVDLFFILSGLVMSMSYGHLFEKRWEVSDYFSLMIRRIARLWPLYIVTLIVTGILTYFIEGKTFPVVVWLANFMMIQTWGIGESINGASWSVSVEWAVYFIFPFIFFPALKMHRIVPFVSFFILVLIIKIGENSGIQRKGPLDIFDPHSALPLMRCFAEFLLGMICYRITFSEYGFFHSKLISVIIQSVTFASLFVSGMDIVSVFLFSSCLVTLTNERNYLSRIVSWTPIYYLGVWSYAIYLWHRSFLFMIGDVWNGHHTVLRPMIIFIILLIVSCLSYYFIEQPWQKKIRRLDRVFSQKSYRGIKISDNIGVNNL